MAMAYVPRYVCNAAAVNAAPLHVALAECAGAVSWASTDFTLHGSSKQVLATNPTARR
jgi:hypothetical protein